MNDACSLRQDVFVLGTNLLQKQLFSERRKCHLFACKLCYPDYEHNLQREHGPNIYWGVAGLVLKSSIILFDQLSTHFSSFCRVEFVTSCLHGDSQFCLVVLDFFQKSTFLQVVLLQILNFFCLSSLLFHQKHSFRSFCHTLHWYYLRFDVVATKK